jgi:hypothetical protein
LIARKKAFRAHAFEYTCAKADIDHRLTKPKLARRPLASDAQKTSGKRWQCGQDDGKIEPPDALRDLPAPASWNGCGQDDWPASQRDFVFGNTPATDRPQDQPSDRATTKD